METKIAGGDLYKSGVIEGYKDGTFKPTNKITRQEFATLLVKALGLPEDPSAAAQFKDVDNWAKPYVGALVNANLTSGIGNGLFGANDNLKREEMAAFFIRGINAEERAKVMNFQSSFSDDAQISDYAKRDVAFAQQIGFILGDGKSFNPQADSERQAVARLTYELLANYSQYVNSIIHLDLAIEDQDIVENEDGSYTLTFPVHNAFVSTDKYTLEGYEIISSHYLLIPEYMELIGYVKEDWAQKSDNEKLEIAQTLIGTWALEHSGQFVNPDIENPDEVLVHALDTFIKDNPDVYPYEPDLVKIGVQSNVLLKE